MPKQYQYNRYGLHPGAHVYARGKVVYSRVRSLIDGEELAQSIQRERAMGLRHPSERPHTRLVVGNFEIVGGDNDYDNAYVAERTFTSAKNPQFGNQYSVNRPGPNLPAVMVSPNLDGHYVTDTEDAELAQGQEVFLDFRSFEGQNGLGMTLDTIYIQGEPHYFRGGGGSNADNATLARFGIVLDEQPRTPAAPAVPANTAPQAAPQQFTQQPVQAPASQPVPAGSEMRDGFVMPAAPQPAAAQPGAQPFGAPAPVSQTTLEQQLAQAQANAPAAGASAFVAPEADEDPWAAGEEVGIRY